jgi:purine-cytosine permease-like protein
VSCGARLRHPKEFAQVMRDYTPTVSVVTFGRVGAVVTMMLYGLALAVAVPDRLADNAIGFGFGALVAMLLGRVLGRFIAGQVNDSSAT